MVKENILEKVTYPLPHFISFTKQSPYSTEGAHRLLFSFANVHSSLWIPKRKPYVVCLLYTGQEKLNRTFRMHWKNVLLSPGGKFLKVYNFTMYIKRIVRFSLFFFYRKFSLWNFVRFRFHCFWMAGRVDNANVSKTYWVQY